MLFACGFNHRKCTGILICAGDDRDFALYYSAFFGGDFFYRAAEILCVVKPDFGYGADNRRSYDVRCVESAAEAGFEYNKVAFFAEKPDKCHCGNLRKHRYFNIQLFNCIFYAGGNFRKVIVGNIFAVYLNPFVENLNIRRCIKPGLIAGFLQNFCGHGADRAFAVRSGNMNKFKPVLRIAQIFKQFFQIVITENC